MKRGPEFTTDRLTIRPLREEDAELIFAYHSDPVANQYQGWLPVTINDAIDFIRRLSPEPDSPGTWFQFVIIRNDNHQVIGDIGIHFLADNNMQAEIGFTLDRNEQGKGYATEALISIIDYLFYKLGKHRVTGSVDPANIKSISLLERLGFRREAHFRESLFIRGRWADDLVYALLRREWDNIKNR